MPGKGTALPVACGRGGALQGGRVRTACVADGAHTCHQSSSCRQLCSRRTLGKRGAGMFCEQQLAPRQSAARRVSRQGVVHAALVPVVLVLVLQRVVMRPPFYSPNDCTKPLGLGGSSFWARTVLFASGRGAARLERPLLELLPPAAPRRSHGDRGRVRAAVQVSQLPGEDRTVHARQRSCAPGGRGAARDGGWCRLLAPRRDGRQLRCASSQPARRLHTHHAHGTHSARVSGARLPGGVRARSAR